jgi:uncharacterized membrane protein YphA (DoxX/SURF4 family)/uncharacterized membrane protein
MVGSTLISPLVISPLVISELLAVAIPNTVIWSYSVGGVIFAIGLVAMFVRGDWQRAQGLEKLILFGPIFYAAPLAAFGTEHFTLTAGIASIVPRYIPWHLFWAYFVGTCFIAAPLSWVTRVQARLSASLVALTFFLFVVLMDAPAWSHHLGNRFFAILTLRELSFSGGALAFAVTLSAAETSDGSRDRRLQVFATIARYFIAIPVLLYSFEQFIHADHVPGVPLEPLTPAYVLGHAIWTYLAAVVYAVAGILLLIGKKTRAAATWLGLTVFFLVLVVYVPIAVVERASLDNGLNYLGDTLMYCGAILLLAGAMPRDE